MSGAPKVRSMNIDEESEARPVLGPAGNKTRSPSVTRKPALKPVRKVETGAKEEKKKEPSPAPNSPTLLSSRSAPSSMLRRQELLLHSNLSMNASCSSDASTDSFCSRASTGRIGRQKPSIKSGRRQGFLRHEKVTAKVEKIIPDGGEVKAALEFLQGKKRCAWVTSNTDPQYVAFHDKEWGVPVHDDRKLFELLVLSGALAELTWPTILSKRHIFREVFMDFDPVAVSKLSEKKLIATGSTASSLLSEAKLRSVVENARQILKIVEEFGSFERYCWSFVNHKPISSRFRYPRQVPVKTAKAEAISKDLVRRGFRSVGPTVIYTFMQVAGLTNDHLISCYRFDECTAATATTVSGSSSSSNNNIHEEVVKDDDDDERNEEVAVVSGDNGINLELSRAVDALSVVSS